MEEKIIFPDYMIDMETVDTVATAGILSIAGVPFNRFSGAISGSTYYNVVSLESQLPIRTISESTMQWWRDQGQSDASKAVWFAELKVTLEVALKALRSHINDHCDSKSQIWSMGASFDIPMLEHAYRQLGIAPAWRYSKASCHRTLKNLPGADAIIKDIKFLGTPHNALDDALHQVKQNISIHQAFWPIPQLKV